MNFGIMMSFNKTFLLLLILATISTAFSQRRSVVADVRFHDLKSAVFGNERKIRVLVPPGYDKDREQTYPVLYLNDGQNLFQINTAQTENSEWGADETYKDLLDSKEIERFIIVGIDNAGLSARANEYLPYFDKFLTPPLSDPQGAKYPDFLTGEVMPFIESEYRVRKGAEFTGLGGASYGALVALYTAIKKPNVFGRLLLESPSFYVSDRQVLKEVAEANSLPDQIYIGVGTNEEAKPSCVLGDLSHEVVVDVLELKEILAEKGFGTDKLKVLIDDCAVHNEIAWGRRFSDAIRFLYGAKED